MSGPRPPEIAISPLDTARFGVRIARIGVASPEDVAGVMEQARGLEVAMVVIRVDADDAPTIHAIEAAGGRLCDTLVWYSRVVDPDQPPPGVRLATAADADRVEALAAAAFAGYVGHYHNDGRLGRAGRWSTPRLRIESCS
jgi:hypothetical protein